MKIAVPADAGTVEPRVAARPETVKKFIGIVAEVAVQAGAGAGSRIPDEEYDAAGAIIAPSRIAVVQDADVVLAVRRPAEADLGGYKRGALLVAMMDPYGHEAELRIMAEAGIVAFAM